MRIRYRARCGDRKMLTSGVRFQAPLDTATASAFEDGGRFEFDLPNGEHARARRPSTAACAPPAAGPGTSGSACGSPQRAVRHELPLRAGGLEGEPRLAGGVAQRLADGGERGAAVGPVRAAVNTVRSARRPRRADGDAVGDAGERELRQQRDRVGRARRVRAAS